MNKLEAQGCEIDDANEALVAEIRDKAELCKIQLSTKTSVRPFFTVNGNTYKVEITREEFEKDTEDLIDRTRTILEDTLRSKDLMWQDVDSLLVVGGATRMPMVRKMLERISGKDIVYKVDPDTAVAQGAAIFASTIELDDNGRILSDARDGSSEMMTISDVTSQSLGVILLDRDDQSKEINEIIIPHNTKIPCRMTKGAETSCDRQSKIRIRVTQGDSTDPDSVKVIGERTLDITPYQKGSPIEIMYAYDPDQTIYVEVFDRTADRSIGHFELERHGNLSEEEVQNAKEKIGNADVA